MSELVTVTGKDFAGSAELDGSTVRVALKGDADYAAFDALETLLVRIHAESKRLGVREVVVDLRQLEFMSSSCFKSIVSWLTDIQELAEAKRYQVKLVSNPSYHWQKRSLHALRSFAMSLITIVE